MTVVPSNHAGARRGSGTDPSMEALVREHLELVDRVVRRVAAGFPRHVDRDELRNAGALGLVEAAKRYDPATGVPFERYAAIRIRGAVLDSTRSRDWASRAVRRESRALAEAEALAAQRPDGTVADHLGASQSDVERIRARVARASLLSIDRDPDDGAAVHQRLVEEGRDLVPEASLLHQETVGTLREAVTLLPETHRQVVQRYWFAGDRLQDIAGDLGVTEARISQINTEAVNALRLHFSELYDGVPGVDENAPGKRARIAFAARLAESSTWRTRLAAADGDVIDLTSIERGGSIEP